MPELLVKGTGIIPVLSYVKEKYGAYTLKKVILGLNENFQKSLTDIYDVKWYPLEILSELYSSICNVIGKGDNKICWDIGRYAADYGLNRVYKFFLRLGSIQLFINKGPTIWNTYYRGSELKILKVEKGYIELKVEGIKTSLSHLFSIAGWCEKAGELVGCKNINVELNPEEAIIKVHYS